MEFIIDYEDDYYDDGNNNDNNSTVKCLKPNKQVYGWLRFCTDMYRILAY